MKLKASIQEFARELDAQDNAVVVLWEWLPSCEMAKKHHGKYYFEFTPAPSDVMIEASRFIAWLTDNKDMLEAECPCGEIHDELP